MEELLKRSKVASFALKKLNTLQKNECLKRIKNALLLCKEQIVIANSIDIDIAKQKGTPTSMIDRLTLDSNRIESIASSIDSIIDLEDPIGEIIEEYTRPSGIKISKVRVPFGLIGAIFEARPNVSVDIAVLCLKTSNACILKGGKEAINSNKKLVEIMKEAIKDIVDPNVINLIEDTSRESTNELIIRKDYLDLLIPRGGKGLIQYIVNNAKVPFIETGAGNCHLYVHKDADIEMAIKIAINAKYQRPSVCNAIENIIVDKKIAQVFLPILSEKFKELNIEIRGDELTRKIIDCKLASEEDFYTEYNDYKVSIKIVDSIDEAISHINEHSSKHSESIITKSKEVQEKFLNEIDSSCVYVNSSTRFTDGGEFGFGTEIGISTSKLHARGPMGLKEITTYKFLIRGNGEVRN